ncbi:MAG: L-2-amino-thiazoline-4-carboxylic acid hydrolase [Promethearchaeota archaeon]
MEEVNRLYSLDALILIPIVIIIFHLILIRYKEFKTILVFHIAGILNFLLEIALISRGTRIIETHNSIIAFLVLFDVSWVTIGTFSALTYINLNKMFKNSDIDIIGLILLNCIFFLGLPLASLNFGIFNKEILTRRIVANPLTQLSLQIIAILLFPLILIIFGYKKLSGLLFLHGIILGISFQSRLYFAGMRQASTASFSTMIIDTFSLATMPIVAGAFLFLIFGKLKFETFGDPPPNPIYIMNIRIALTGLKSLKVQIGWKATFSIIKQLIQQRKKGEPWIIMEKAVEKKDIDSRALIGDVILIYRRLMKNMDKEKALKIVKKVIVNSAITQLYSLAPLIKKHDMQSRTQEENKDFIIQLIEKFPNTDWELLEATQTSFRYKITRCRLVELVNDLGYPELADAFCPGDALYFERYQPDIKFTRPFTIGYGQECCDFQFKLKI